MNQVSSLWAKTNYLAPFPYLVNTSIIEYDMSKANISILYRYGYIDKETYDRLYNADKQFREIYIGKMELKDSKVTEIKRDGIKEYRHKFFEANSLEDKDILSIKNDAIYVIGKQCQYTLFDDVINFRTANVYTSYFKLGKLEVYYWFDPVTSNEVIDIKGIKDYKLELHREYMISHLCDVFYKLQTCSIEEAIKSNSELLDSILTRHAHIGYYREFNSESLFRYTTKYSAFYTQYAEQKYSDIVDPSVNVSLLQNISSILSDIYLSKFNKKGKR